MKNLIFNSVKIVRSFCPISNLYTITRIGTYQFATASPKKVTKPKSKKIEKCEIDTVNQDEESLSRQSAKKELINLMNSYISMDDLKAQPGALRSLLLNMVKVLEYEKDNKGREFYLQHKEKLEKFFYDVRSYNAQNFMTTQEIILTFYLKKIFRDFGVNQAPTGFELRAGIKLANQIQVKQDEPVADKLSVSQAFCIYFLMSRLDISNHNFKWNCMLMMQEIIGKWKKAVHNAKSQKNEPGTIREPPEMPIKFDHIVSLFSSFYNETVHISSDYQTVSCLISLLFEMRDEYCSYNQLMKDENMFLELFSCIIGLEQHQFHGNSGYELREVYFAMASAIERRLISWITKDQAVIDSFVEAKNLTVFLSQETFTPFQTLYEKDKTQNFTIPGLQQEHASRYFILLNEVHQNQKCLALFSGIRHRKIRFALTEILDRYLVPKLQNKDIQISELQLSMITRTWVKKVQLSLNKIQARVQSRLEKEKIAQQANEIMLKFIRQFQELMEVLTKQISLKIQQIQNPQFSKAKKKPYLTAKQKQIEEQKNVYLRNVQTNIVKPLIDFLFSNGKICIDSKQYLVQHKRQMIDRFEIFLTEIFGDSVSTDQNGNEVKQLSIQNKYFWMLRLMRIEWSSVTENKVYLKEFENLLLDIVVKNNMKKKPENYHESSIFNLYAYMCKLQEKMMENEEKSMKGKEELEILDFEKKKEYSYFLAYKSYIAKLIFARDIESFSKQVQSQKDKALQIPKKLRIDRLFVRSSQNDGIEKQKIAKDKQKTDKSENIFNISKFFTAIFRENRFYNHKLLSEQVLLYLFGTEELMKENILQYIQKQNQRSLENYYELIYMILLASDNEMNVKTVPHNIPLRQIKRTVFQEMTEKAKGSMIIVVLRDIIGPRKISFLKPTLLKYRQRPYSIFETVCNESTERKKEIALTLFDVYRPEPPMMFGLLETLLLNLNVWGKPRSQVLADVILQTFWNKISKGDQIDGFLNCFLLNILRLIRFQLTEVNSQSEGIYLQIIDYILPPMFENLQRITKSFWRFQIMIGYLLDFETSIQYGYISAKGLLPILVKCHQNILKSGEVNINDRNQKNRFFYSFYDVFVRCLTLCQNHKIIPYQTDRKDSQSMQTKTGSWLPRKSVDQTLPKQDKRATNRGGSLFKKNVNAQSTENDQNSKKGFVNKSRVDLKHHDKQRIH